MGNYRAVCSTSVDATSDQLEEPVPQTDNDYMFVEHELMQKGRVDREFIVCAGVAYFRKPQKVKPPIMKLRYGRELLSLSVSHCYRDLKVEVAGVDDNEKTVKSQASVTANMSQKKLVTPTPVELLTDPYADAKSRADIRAQAEARREKMRGSIGHGRTLGLPEIVPGRFIEIENVDSFIDKKYYITEVTHIYTNDVFETQFEIGGC